MLERFAVGVSNSKVRKFITHKTIATSSRSNATAIPIAPVFQIPSAVRIPHFWLPKVERAVNRSRMLARVLALESAEGALRDGDHQRIACAVFARRRLVRRL